MSILSYIIRLALLSLIFTACTTVNMISNHSTHTPYTDSAFLPIVNQFVQEGAARNIKVRPNVIDIVFGDTKTDDNPSTVGDCVFFRDRSVQILIDRDFWIFASSTEKEQLLFHELAHCFLNREHCDVQTNGVPVSIMGSKMMRDDIYVKNRKTYVDEMFHADNRCK